MASHDQLARERASARFKLQEQRADSAKQALLEVEAERRAVAERTARLRELRLAKEAADLTAALPIKKAAQSKKKR